jgi:Amt family ammonium transporter
VRRQLTLSASFALLLAGGLAAPVLAAPPTQSPSAGPADLSLLVVGFTLLLPAGLILLNIAALAEGQAAAAATGGLVAWGLAVVAYFAAGFAFQFGGIAVVHNTPGLSGLYWEYSLLDTTWGTGWGMVGLRGFLMLGDAATPAALALFLAQIPFLGLAVLILYFTLQGRAPRWVILLASLLMGSLVYPLIGNWTWGGGWLANLGRNLAQGHGLIDAGGSGQAALTGAATALAALLIFRPGPSKEAAQTPPPSDEPEAVPMPPVHLPLLGLLGAMLMAVGWMAAAFMLHLPTAAGTSPALAAANLMLGAFGGALAAGLYSWFTTSGLDPLMTARGWAAGLVVAAAGAPFVPAWSALVGGLVVGLCLPLFVFLFDRVLRLDDTGGALATFGLPALLGLLLPALLSDGRYGVGWNGVGADKFLGVVGQGVSGWLVAPGFAADWPGQVYAQCVGAAAIFVWSFGLSGLLLRFLAGIIHAWERTGLEFGAPPQPVAEVEVVEPGESAMAE